MPRLSLRPAARLQGRLKLARLMAMREEEAARLSRALEADPLFARLRAAGAVRRERFPAAFFAARRMAGRSLVSPGEGLGELLDGRSDLAALMRRVGAENLRAHFLDAGKADDAAAARACGIAAAEAARLRAWLDRLYIRTEFQEAPPAPAVVFSTVAGIAVRRGRPELRFFHREIWEGAYAVDEKRLALFSSALAPAARRKARRLVERAALLDRRKTALYRALEALLGAQAGYLRSGDPDRRQPLTQRSLAVAIGVEASALNRLLSNKAVELPWGVEAPLKSLLPSAKSLALGKLETLARASPSASDESLRRALADRHRVYLSRRSVAQYRMDCGLSKRRRRA